jgi:hypothetical protein
MMEPNDCFKLWAVPVAERRSRPEEERGRRSAAKLLTKDEAKADRCERGEAAGAVAEGVKKGSRIQSAIHWCYLK